MHSAEPHLARKLGYLSNSQDIVIVAISFLGCRFIGTTSPGKSFFISKCYFLIIQERWRKWINTQIFSQTAGQFVDRVWSPFEKSLLSKGRGITITLQEAGLLSLSVQCKFVCVPSTRSPVSTCFILWISILFYLNIGT